MPAKLTRKSVRTINSRACISVRMSTPRSLKKYKRLQWIGRGWLLRLQTCHTEKNRKECSLHAG